VYKICGVEILPTTADSVSIAAAAMNCKRVREALCRDCCSSFPGLIRDTMHSHDASMPSACVVVVVIPRTELVPSPTGEQIPSKLWWRARPCVRERFFCLSPHIPIHIIRLSSLQTRGNGQIFCTYSTVWSFPRESPYRSSSQSQNVWVSIFHLSNHAAFSALSRHPQ